jgi:hypothetical protein
MNLPIDPFFSERRMKSIHFEGFSNLTIVMSLAHALVTQHFGRRLMYALSEKLR